MSATALREEVASFVASHPDALLSGTPVREWVEWDCNLSTSAYAARMRGSGQWGGAIEIAITAMLKRVEVRVYEPAADRAFRLISAFGAAELRWSSPPSSSPLAS